MAVIKLFKIGRKNIEKNFLIFTVIGIALVTLAILGTSFQLTEQSVGNSSTAVSLSNYVAAIDISMPDDIEAETEALQNLDYFIDSMESWELEILNMLSNTPKYIDLFIENTDDNGMICTYFGYFVTEDGVVDEFLEQKSFNFQIFDDLSGFSGDPRESVTPDMIVLE